MIDSKLAHFLLDKSADVCIFVSLPCIVCLISQLPSGSAAMFAIQVPLPKYLIFFCCCAAISKSVVVRRAALSPLAHQRTAEEHRVSVSSSSSGGSVEALPVARVTPTYPGICNFKLCQAPETRILAHVSVTGWRADQLLPIAAARNLPTNRPIQARLPSTPRDAGPASRVLLPELLPPVALQLLCRC